MRPIIIFGAGIVGEALYHACQSKGIQVECFCDNNINKVGKNVIYTPRLKEKYKDALFLISAADMHDAVKQLESLGYSKWYPASSLLRNFDLHRYKYSAPVDFVEYAVSTAILCQDNYDTDKLFLRSVDIIVTERCSLKCRDCSNLMRHYKDPKDCSLDGILQEIDLLCGVIDEINEFRVLGGEPFMNKDAHLIIKRLINEPKAKKVVVYTNGTIVPRDEQIAQMKSDKLLFIITDYGVLSRNIAPLVEKLSANKIAFYVQKAKGWTDCSKINKHDRSNKQQAEIFGKCCAKNTITLSNGRLFRCPFSGNAARLGAFNFEEDSVGLDDKNKIKEFLFKKTFLKSCDYCNGRSFDDPEIEPAIQEN